MPTGESYFRLFFRHFHAYWRKLFPAFFSISMPTGERYLRLFFSISMPTGESYFRLFSAFPCLLAKDISGFLSLLKRDIIFHYVRIYSTSVYVSLCLQIYHLFLLIIIYSLLSFLVFLSLVMEHYH
jgi:hypothetical protein